MGLVIFVLVLCVIVRLFKIAIMTDHAKCYSKMETQGIAVFGMCGGVVGGDKGTEYLDYKCIDCPYYVGFNGKEK